MLTATFFLALLAVASAKPSVRMVHHEGREAAPRGYTQVAPAASSKEIKLRIALAQNNMPGLIKALYDVSTPSSASYGDHLSKEEVRVRSSSWSLPD
jgi:tripeptidyl-peptidase-1